MNYNKKGFLSLALVGSLSLNFVLAACHGKSTAETNETNTKKVYVGTWAKVDAVAFNGHEDAVGLRVSGDKSYAYIVLDGAKYLAVLDVNADFANRSQNVTHWHKIELQMTGGGPGKAELSSNPNNQINTAKASAKGVVLSITGVAPNENGVWYIEGRDFKAGWATNNMHIDNTVIVNGQIIYGFVAKKGNTEYPLILSSGGYGILSNATFDTPTALQNNRLTRKGTPFQYFDSYSIAVMGASDFYIIDNLGINVIPEAALGEDASFKVDDPSDPAFDASLKSDQWGTLGGTANRNPSSAFFDNGKLYIGFASYTASAAAAPTAGGVAVHEVASKTTKAPHADWTGTAITSFAKDEEGNVWAVTLKGLIEVVVGPSTVDMGKKLNNTEMANYAVPADPSSEADYTAIVDNSYAYTNTLMPDNTVGAAFFGKHLLVISHTAGVHVLTFKEKSYKKP